MQDVARQVLCTVFRFVGSSTLGTRAPGKRRSGNLRATRRAGAAALAAGRARISAGGPMVGVGCVNWWCRLLSRQGWDGFAVFGAISTVVRRHTEISCNVCAWPRGAAAVPSATEGEVLPCWGRRGATYALGAAKTVPRVSAGAARVARAAAFGPRPRGARPTRACGRSIEAPTHGRTQRAGGERRAPRGRRRARAQTS